MRGGGGVAVVVGKEFTCEETVEFSWEISAVDLESVAKMKGLDLHLSLRMPMVCGLREGRVRVVWFGRKREWG